MKILLLILTLFVATACAKDIPPECKQCDANGKNCYEIEPCHKRGHF
jgi:hypothetical protein